MTDLRAAQARPQAVRGAPDRLLGAAAAARPRRHPGEAQHRPLHAAAAAIRFADGSEEEIDLVVYCTGYKMTFPFFEPEVFAAPDNRLPLYRRVASVERPGLYFIGFIQPLGPIMPLAEAQCEWVADLLGGRAALPPAEEMRTRDRDAKKGRCGSASSPLSVIRSRSTSIPTCARSGASESRLRSGLDDPGAAARRAGRQRHRGAAAVGPAARAARQLRLRPPALEAAVGVLGRASGSGVAWLAHQTSQIDPRTGIFRTTSRKKIGQNPVTGLSVESQLGPAAFVLEAARPGDQRFGFGLLEAEVRLGRDQQGRLRPRPRPLVTALVEVVVDPGHRPALRSRPSSGPSFQWAEPKRAAPSKVRWGSSGRPSMLRQVVVRFVLPAGGPDQLVVLGEPLQPLAGEQRDAVDHAVDQLEPGHLGWSGGSSKPNREMTPSTSTARIGRLIEDERPASYQR